VNNCKRSIGWADYTWNPLTGCLHSCSYCYARRITTRFAGGTAFPNGFAPTWHPERLMEPVQHKAPARIFVGSMTDPFGDWVQPEQLDLVLEVIAACPQHAFYMLTKAPQNIMRKLYEVTEAWPCRELGGGDVLPNLWLGASVDTQKRALSSLSSMAQVTLAGWRTFVSIEPMLSEVDPVDVSWSDWMIIGAMTGPGSPKHAPRREWVETFIAHGNTYHVPVFLKSSITKLWPDLDRREWPEEMR